MGGSRLPFRTGLQVAWLAATMVLAAACGRGDGEPPAEPAQRTALDREAAASPAPAFAQPMLVAARDLPAAGQAVVEIGDRGVTVLANQVPRLELMRQLEQATGFKLVVGRVIETEPAPETVLLVDVPLGEALTRILEGVAFQLHYSVDAEGGGHRISQVAVGEPQRRRRERRDRETRTAATRERREARRPERQALARQTAERTAEAPRLLEDADPAVRARGAAWLALDGDGVERLSDALSNDPAPAVRAAAAERLAHTDSLAAVTQLLTAIHDGDSQVVIAALDALEWVGDESIIPQLSPLLKHHDPAVRVRTVEAIEFLE
ncbi:MAG: HEAT repeat domain-containing protein [Myxococcales bacterium]|nr:HEAT repeat domain-containing protein [Myxococcales bacterium]